MSQLTYDDCKEQAVEIQMVEELNCVVPFIESNHSVCKTKNIQKQAVLLSGTKLRFKQGSLKGVSIICQPLNSIFCKIQ